MKILIVEDEPSLREIMVQTLRREQYVVEQASDYASALEKIAGYDYDCILLDTRCLTTAAACGYSKSSGGSANLPA